MNKEYETPKTCNWVMTADGWHFHQCGKPAKFHVPVVPNSVWLDKPGYLCGVHARKFKGSPELVKL